MFSSFKGACFLARYTVVCFKQAFMSFYVYLACCSFVGVAIYPAFVFFTSIHRSCLVGLFLSGYLRGF